MTSSHHQDITKPISPDGEMGSESLCDQARAAWSLGLTACLGPSPCLGYIASYGSLDKFLWVALCLVISPVNQGAPG